MSEKVDVIIIGAGIAGLIAAQELKSAKRKVLILEASDRIGGRIKTDKYEGFLLDHGFQVLLSAYPEIQANPLLKNLKSCAFKSGSMLMTKGKTHVVADPFREPLKIFSTLFAPIGSLVEKFKILKLRQALWNKSIEAIFEEEETTTKELLSKKYGFNNKIIKRFFTPFFSGIFIESELKTSSRMFEFIFKMFADGEAVLPNGGMQAIPESLAKGLAENELLLSHKVDAIEEGKVTCSNGKTFESKQILIATEASGLVDQYISEKENKKVLYTYYFSTTNLPKNGAYLHLNTHEEEWVNHVAFLSRVNPSYAPLGQTLVSVNGMKNEEGTEEEMIEKIKEQLMIYFDTSSWNFLKSYRIKKPLPSQNSVYYEPKATKVKPGIFVAGDHLCNGSINNALLSGRKAAAAILNQL